MLGCVEVCACKLTSHPDYCLMENHNHELGFNFPLPVLLDRIVYGNGSA